MIQTNIINQIIAAKGFRSYLEIGVNNPVNNFDLIKCKLKIGVDPNGRATFTGTSDEWFHISQYRFDIIFIDGLHHYEQVKRDYDNSLKSITQGGIIVLHDTNPEEEGLTSVPRVRSGRWNGEVYRILPQLTGDWATCDWDPNGTTVVKPGIGKEGDPFISYSEFCQNKNILHIMNKEMFAKWI